MIHHLKRILGYLRRYPDRDGIVFIRPERNTPILRQAADASLGDAPKGRSTLGNVECVKYGAIHTLYSIFLFYLSWWKLSYILIIIIQVIDLSYLTGLTMEVL